MSDFFSTMQPYAAKASAALGIPVGVILAQWANESARGTSTLAKSSNNFAGINHSANSIAIGSDGVFAKYQSKDQFVQDYIRVMSLSYYDTVRSEGKSGDVMGTIRALGASPWAGSHYGYSAAGEPGQNLNDLYYAENLSRFDKSAPQGTTADPHMIRMAAIGAAAVALISLIQQD